MPEEIKKITVSTTEKLSPAPVNAAGTRSVPGKKKSFPWAVLLLPLVVVVGIVAVLGAMLLPLRGVYAKVQPLVLSGHELADAIKNQNLDLAKEKLVTTRERLSELDTEYKKVIAIKAIPVLGAYIADGEHVIKAAYAGLDAGDNAIAALAPQADLLGLKGGSKFVQGTADERLQTAVKTMGALTPKINAIAKNIEVLQKELDAVDPARYPKNIRGIAVQDQMIAARDVIDNAASLFINAQPLLSNLPKLLGDPDEKRYLVLFFNDKELRSVGGFITAYAQFRMVKGKMILEKTDDIYKLDDAMKKKFPAPREILTFHKGVYDLHLRDSNLSPDFKLSMQKFEELYDTVGGKEKIDGIWGVDTHVLVEALKILGPMTVSGREFTAETDKRCDCPRAVYELEDYSSRPVGYVRENRKDEIGVLLHSLLQKALGVSPSQYWGRLFQMLLSEINQKHVLAYFHDPGVQKAAESFNMAGRIMTASETATLLKYAEGKGWDYLHVNDSNMAGAKANLFVSQKVIKDVTVNGDGTMTTKLMVDYKNPFKGSDCGLESGGLCLNAPLRDWVRVYVPAGSKLVDSKGTQSPKDGKPVGMETYDSLDKTVFEGFLIVNPLGTAKLELTYTSPVKEEGGKYRLLIQKQPGTDRQEYLLRLGGHDRKKFILESDTELVF